VVERDDLLGHFQGRLQDSGMIIEPGLIRFVEAAMPATPIVDSSTSRRLWSKLSEGGQTRRIHPHPASSALSARSTMSYGPPTKENGDPL
jgi:hypothetical protein